MPRAMAHPADLVGEGDLDRVPAIVDELAHLGDRERHLEQRRLDAVVDAQEPLGDAGLALADDDLGRGEIVLDGRGLAQELGIEGDLVAPAGRLAGGTLQRRQHQPVHGPGRHRAAEHQQQRLRRPALAERLAELARALQQMRQVELAVAARRRADADDHHVQPVEIAVDGDRTLDPPLADAGAQQLLDHGLDHGRAPGTDGGHLVEVDVDAQHVVPSLGEAGGGGGADIAETENGDVQG